MNLRTKGTDTIASSYATLASGRRVSVPGVDPFFQVKELLDERPAATWVEERIGIAPQAGAVYPFLVPFREGNRIGATDTLSLMLGEVLQRAGYRTAVWGNADRAEEQVRFAPFLSMDRNGWTREAAIDKRVLRRKPGRPSGVKTDYDYVFAQWRKSNAHFRVIELGDLYRLHEEASLMTSERQKAVELATLKEMDHFLDRLLSEVGKGEGVWVLSPYIPPKGTGRLAMLAPAIWYEPGKAGGLLSSPTTRRVGILANVDFAPTVFTQFGLEIPRFIVGQSAKQTEGNLALFWNTLDQVFSVYRLRPFVIYAYALYQVTTLVIAIGLLLNKGERRTGALQMALLAIVLTPVLFLLLGTVSVKSYWVFSALLMGLALIVAALLIRLPTVPLFFLLGFVGFVPVVVDGLLGGRLIRQSFLGYDPIIGARYYGIGNEYMGVVLGSVILMVAAYLEWRRPRSRWVPRGIAVLFGLLVFYFAAPFWGTNAGGALAASVGFGVAYSRFFRHEVRWRFWIAVISLGILGLAILFVLNVLLPSGPPSHIGRAFAHLLSGDFAEIADIATRKLAMNLRLIKASMWGKVFFISFMAMTVLIIQPLRGVKWLQHRYPYLFQGFVAIVVAAFSALVFNDSGIVSAATAIVYVVIPLLLIICRDWNHETGPQT